MRRIPVSLLMILALALAVGSAFAASEPVFARLDTDMGGILVVFESESAPHHVANFTHLAETGFYAGTTFHRVIPGFMIQGGDFNTKNSDRSDDGRGFPLWSDVLSEQDAELVARASAILEAKGYVGMGTEARLKAELSREKHRRGTLSMARAQQIDSAGSQFFICVSSAPALDGKYTIFGQVVEGLDVVDAIVEAPRDSRDNPLEKIVLRKVEILTGEDGLTDSEREAWRREQSVESLNR